MQAGEGALEVEGFPDGCNVGKSDTEGFSDGPVLGWDELEGFSDGCELGLGETLGCTIMVFSIFLELPFSLLEKTPHWLLHSMDIYTN